MEVTYPVTILNSQVVEFEYLVDREIVLLTQSRKLFDAGFPDHALLDIWNASIHNLRRRTESYGVELFQSITKDQTGRKNYKQDGETISERWSGVDDLVLIKGATRLRILDKKAGKALEMINWMRNNASPAHDSDAKVDNDDVIAFAILLQKNLFAKAMPDAGHSPSGLFNPIKSNILQEDGIQLLKDQIISFKRADIRIAFGFLLDQICIGEDPAYSNSKHLWPTIWEKASDDLKKTAGERYHTYLLNIDTEEDTNKKGEKFRILEILIEVGGVKYIPEAARGSVYRQAARNLASAKDSSYGWSREEATAKTLKQFGLNVPSIAFDEVYQEILSVWCGNYWGRSDAHIILKDFIDTLGSLDILKISRMFLENERVNSELFQSSPKYFAKELLNYFKSKLSIESHIGEMDEIIKQVTQY